MAGLLWLDLGPEPTALGEVRARLGRLGWQVLQGSSEQALQVGLKFAAVVVQAPREAMRRPHWQRTVMAASALPTLVLMDPPDPLERVIALELGATAVQLAPFTSGDVGEVVARVQALVRRRHVQAVAAHLADYPDRGDHPDDGDHGEPALLRDWLRQAVEAGQWGLSASERLVLRALLDQPGRVMSRGELLQRTGLAQLGRQPNVVDLAVSRLRRKLPGWGMRAQGIRTLRGQGYVWAHAESDGP